MFRKMVILLALLVLCLAIGSAIIAAPHSPAGILSIPWWTVDGGGGRSSGGAYAVAGTIGQADAHESAAGAFSLSGGFWQVTKKSISYGVYLPAALK